MERRQPAGDVAVTDIEDAAVMQKEKPPFQAIPNWRMSRQKME
jgi:hypothetical protein